MVGVGVAVGGRRWRRALTLTLLALAVATPVRGGAASRVAPTVQERPEGAAAPAVYLMTFEPGAEIWERFGHNALWIHDPAAGTDVAYHYGLFDMSEDGFLLHFLQGRMFYSMGDAPALALLDLYRRAGRQVVVQELRIEADRARDLQAYLEWNMRPENRVYRYDYFRDNCSTRIRDALDRALGGALSSALRSRPSSVTFRQEALALTARDRLLTAGIDLGLGPLADQPISRWELAFIPMRLRDDIRDLRVEWEGRRAPLVAAEHEFGPPGVADTPPSLPPARVGSRVGWMLVLGLLLGGAFAAMGWLAARSDRRRRGPVGPWTRWALAVAGAGWGLVTGVLGLILLALWMLTDHEFAHANENLLQANPLALALVVLIPLAVATPSGRGGRWALGLALSLAALSLVGLLLRPLPLTPQATMGVIALALPAHLGLAWALWRVRGTVLAGALSADVRDL